LISLFTPYTHLIHWLFFALSFSKTPHYLALVFRTADFHYNLPTDLIAQVPADRRDSSRLLVLNRTSRHLEHRQFTDFPALLRPGDLLVLNNSKVIPARLRAIKPDSGGAVEILLIEEIAPNDWWVMLKPGKRVRAGTLLQLLDPSGAPTPIHAQVLEKSDEGHYRLQFTGAANLLAELTRLGEMPLPPYIRRAHGPQPADADRYQTVFAQPSGSVAAPTAGLHFTQEILHRIQTSGVEIAHVTLHVGLGTFSPVKADSLAEHRMHQERYEITPEAARQINAAKTARRRVIAVGTTSLRVLESAAAQTEATAPIIATTAKTRLFVYPPYQFKIVDALLTNFHLPESTLLMLVAAFAAPGRTEGRELILHTYAEAIRARYRFFSYGDAMFIQ
jgi:S-adenosylmethionine:tRNA ribosyltransferase-isomerase